MRDLIKKFVEIEQNLANSRGEFALFALFLREDSVDKWDLIVAAEWIEANRKEALSTITLLIHERLTPNELSSLSRVVFVELANPALNSIKQTVHIQHGVAEVRDSNFFGLPIKHAYIITAQAVGQLEETPV